MKEPHPTFESVEELCTITRPDFTSWERFKQDIRELQDRVSKLESSHKTNPGIRRTVTKSNSVKNSFSAAKQEEGLFCTWSRLVRSQRFAKLQCIWLLTCSVGFLYYATRNFIQTKINEDNEWKPQRMLYAIDHTEIDVPYEMPYVYIYFYVSLSDAGYNNDDSYLTEVRINDTLSQLLESQNNFTDSVTMVYWLKNYTKLYRTVGVEEAIVGYLKEWVETDGFWAFFQLKVNPPVFGLGAWETTIRVRCDLLTLNDTLQFLHFGVLVDRERTASHWQDMNYLDYDYDHWWQAYIYYEEVVLHTWDEGVVSTMWSWLDAEIDYEQYCYEYYDIDLNCSDTWGFTLVITPKLMVKHWAEFVAYGYWDWFAAMGGVLSITSIVYAKVAHYVAKKYGNDSMGILPPMFAVFKNREQIALLKHRQDELFNDENQISFK